MDQSSNDQSPGDPDPNEKQPPIVFDPFEPWKQDAGHVWNEKTTAAHPRTLRFLSARGDLIVLTIPSVNLPRR